MAPRRTEHSNDEMREEKVINETLECLFALRKFDPSKKIPIMDINKSEALAILKNFNKEYVLYIKHATEHDPSKVSFSIPYSHYEGN